MPELETRLARERADLLDAIEQPPLERVGARAAGIRHRRRARRAGAVLAVVAAAGFVALRPWSTDQTQPPPVADPSPSPGVVYTDAGITINGLTGDGFIDPRGWITDVAFADPDHGYALIQCRAGEDPCKASLARSVDGGVTWTLATPPPALGAEPDLTAFPDGRLVVGEYVTTNGGQTWQATTRPSGPASEIGKGQLLRLGGNAVEVWSSMFGNRGQLVAQPPGMTVNWVAGAPTAGGAWWVGGTRNGAPAVAVTRDGGSRWSVRDLDSPGSTAQVSALGDRVYVTVLGADREISAIYRSTDSGQQFSRTSGPLTTPSGLAGEVVPLLDGRLLVTGTDQRWYLSEDDGRTFTLADSGTLPAVGPILRTTAGYVAYDLFGSDWAAFSADGSTWRKLQVN